MRLAPATISLACMLVALPGQAEESDRPPGIPKASFLIGLGTATGWVGGQLEIYFADGRFSSFLGAGYTPALEDSPAVGLTGALGMRAFTGGRVHRGFLELSVSQIVVEEGLSVPGERTANGLYGPGVQLGYQLLKPKGFTFLASAGVGVVVGGHPGHNRLQALATIALGKTWRRQQ